MSGYFQRLMNRGAGADALIHPLSRLPYAAIPESDPFGERGELTTAPRAWEQPPSAGRAEGPAAEAAPLTHHEAPAALVRSPAPRMNSDATGEPFDAALAPEVSLPRSRVLGEGVTSATRNAPSMPPVAQAATEQPVVSPQPPGERVKEHLVNEASESFRVMTPRTAAHTVAPFESLSESVAGRVQAAKEQPVVSPQPPGDRLEEHPVNELSESFRLMTPRTLVHAVRPFESPPESEAGRMQAAHFGLNNRPSVRAQNNQPGMSATPDVHVSIGRIEVTAVQAPMPPKGKSSARRKATSLDAYLAKRQEGRA